MKEKYEHEDSFYKALEQGRIRAYYQPMYTAEGFRIASAEALCRWEKPDGSMILPDDFIPMLEETGEICLLDWHMAERICRLLSEMRYKNMEPVPISLNLSRRHSEEWDAAEHLASVADAYCLDHRLVEAEITETYASRDGNLQKMIRKIRENGFHG